MPEPDMEGLNLPKIEFLKTEDESEVKEVKCPFCDKYFVPTSILKHLSRSKKCKPFSSPDLQAYLKDISIAYSAKKHISLSDYNKQYHQRNKSRILRRKRDHHEANKTEICAKKQKYFRKNKAEVSIKKKIHYIKKEEVKKMCKEHQKLFEKETLHHPVFPCISCERDLYPRSVIEVSDELVNFLKANNLIQFVNLELKLQGKCYMCNTCKRHFMGSKMPPQCSKNGLQVLDRPDCMKVLQSLEKQLIKKSLPFLKVRKLPRTRMDATNDRLINVPISDDDIAKTVKSLPRTPDKDGFINLKYKRKMEYKSYYKFETVRPHIVYESLLYLKEHHPEYKGISILPWDEYLASLQNENTTDDKNETLDDHETSRMSLTQESSGDEEEEEREQDECNNPFSNVTCLCPDDPTSSVIVNTGTKSIKKKTSKKSSKVYEVAPGEGRMCNDWARDKKFEITAFPHLFPNGTGSFHSPREKKVTLGEYFCQKILHHSGIYSEDPDYVFSAEQLLEKTQVENQIDVSMRKGKVVDDGNEKKIVNCEDAFSIFKSLPGTPPYWRQFRYEMLARLEQLGPFNFFFTLSAAEMRWEEVLAAILKKEGKNVSFEEDENGKGKYIVNGMSLEQYNATEIKSVTDLLKNHYVLITRMFDNRVKAFIKNILMNHKVKWYTYRIEFQVRGMPHIHGVFWLDEEEKKKYQIDGKYDRVKVVDLIDDWVSCSLTTEDEELNKIVSEVNCHKHTKSCRKYKTNCRFHFPRLPSDETLIARPLSDDMPEAERKSILKSSKHILEKAKKALEELDEEKDDLSLTDFLGSINVNYEDYKNALRVSEKGDVVILRRTVKERNVNNYNKCFAKVWNANTDIQFCMDLHAIVTYITDYFSKEDSGLTKLLKQAITEKKGCDDFQRLNYVKKVYFTHRQKNLSEATFKIINGLNLKQSNVKTIFVSTGFPENRSIFLKKCQSSKVNYDFESENEASDEEDGQFQGSSEKFSIQGRSGKYVKPISIHEKYATRPIALDDLCFAQFATSYVSTKKPKEKVEFNEDVSVSTGPLKMFDSNEELPTYIRLSNDSYMKLKQSPFVMRTHASHKKEGHEENFAELLLFFPWRDETEELFPGDQQMCIETFNRNLDIINKNRKYIFPFSEEVKEITEFMKNSEDNRPQHIYDTLDPIGEQEDYDDENELEPLDKSELPGEIHEGHFPEQTKYKPIEVESDEKMLEIVRNLSKEQLIVFLKVIDFCKKMSASNHFNSLEAPRIIVHGGGGVGKSFLIKAISMWAEKILRKPGDNPLKPKVLLLAPTGMAACLIGGTTLQTGLGLKFGTKYLPLKDIKREELRVLFEDLQLIIVDEFSMVSADALYDIHRRLQEILISDDYFGGCAVLLVGDLLQLPPVKGRKIFSKPISDKNISLWSSDKNLWSSFEVVTLTINYRQGVSKWTECLNRLRIGILTDEDRKLLEERRLKHFPNVDQGNACHVFYSNYEVDTYNMKMLESFPGDQINLQANIVVPRGYKPYITPHGTIDDTQFRKILTLKVGVRVMLTFNVNISDSLINGAMGTVLGFIYGHNSSIKAVVISFDDTSVGVQQRTTYQEYCKDFVSQNGTPIFRTTLRTPGKSVNSMNAHGASCKITQFPLRLSFASTGHKLQGTGITSELIAHGCIDKKGKDIQPPKSLYYVMLSRCTKLDNIYLDERFELDKIKCSEKVLNEAKRLDEISLNNTIEEKDYDIFYVNIRSLEKHDIDIWKDLFAKQSKYCCFTETWLDPSRANPYQIHDKLVYHASYGRGKGACILAPAEKPSQSFQVCTKNFQIVSLPAMDFQLTVVYLSFKEAHLPDVIKAMEQILDLEIPQVILGDFNFDATEENCLKAYFSQMKLVQVINQPTHKDGRTLDHLYLSEELKERLEYDIQFKYYTDHSAIQMKIK